MTSDYRWKKRLNSFSKALERLEESLNQKDWQDLEKDGVIKRFEFTFELAWKTLQDFFESQGYKNIKGPKKVIQQAFEDGYIIDDQSWVDLLSDRNLMAHTYDKTHSDQVFEKIQNIYFQSLCDLFHILEKESKK